ncbi:MAG TPA: ABC transporter permease [Jatrophihabitans sp.]
MTAPTAATTRRVLLQLRHDPRTVVLLLAVPAVLMVLLRYVFDSKQQFSAIAPTLLGIFPFLLMFLVTSIATLRERSSGTLERLMTTPLPKLALIAGYGGGFGLVALLQVAVTIAVSELLGMTVAGPFGWLAVVIVLDALLGVALGLFASAFASTEFQAIQLMPVVVLPQLLLCGLFQPRAEMAVPLQWIANVLPLPYAVEALQYVAHGTAPSADFSRDVLVLAAFVVGAVIAAAATLRRRTA